MDHKRMLYKAERHEYWLAPEIWRDGHDLFLVGAGMYTLEGHYIGYWESREMPKSLWWQINAFLEGERIIPIGRRLKGIPRPGKSR